MYTETIPTDDSNDNINYKCLQTKTHTPLSA